MGNRNICLTMHQDDALQVQESRRFHDRRRESPMPVLLEMVKQIRESQVTLEKQMADHMKQETDALTTAVKKILEDSFPDGDPAGHKKFHEASIAKAEAEAKFWQEMRVAAAKWAGLGVLGFIATAVWIAIKAEVHK